MKMAIREGNYIHMGAVQAGNQVMFTFHGEKEDVCKLVLVERNSGEKETILVPDDFCLGSLRSIGIGNMRASDYYYYYEINGKKVIDPYCTSIVGREIWNDAKREEKEYEIFSGVAEQKFDWKKDVPPEIDRSDMLLYKLHVRGFTMDCPSAKKNAGTFSAVRSKIPYLKSLGVTSVELMPVYEFEEMELPVKLEVPEYVKWEKKEDDLISPLEEEKKPKRVNMWGYGPGNYFAVKSSYAAEPHMAAKEFKLLVRKLHENHMECIMEFFFEGGTNHNLILDALRYWVKEFHIDGFHLIGDDLPITAIVQDVMLSRTKILYAGFEQNILRTDRKYQPLYVYKDEYLYPARKLLNHQNGQMREFLDQQRKQGEVVGYINYITSNNGFTLADLFMYNDRHNEANGEDNFDGNPWNFSNNYGVEGPTRKRYIRSIRSLKWRNAMMMLFLAQGVPMIWAGDEISNSQEGNNNAYCQDNPIGWVNWRNEKTHRGDLAFLRKLVAFRREHPVLSQKKPFRFQDYRSYGAPDLSYHGENAWVSGYELDRKCIGLMYCGEYGIGEGEKEYVYIAYNFFSAHSLLALPRIGKEKRWYLVANSSNEMEPFLEEPVLCVNQKYMEMNPQAICILVGK